MSCLMQVKTVRCRFRCYEISKPVHKQVAIKFSESLHRHFRREFNIKYWTGKESVIQLLSFQNYPEIN